MGLFSNWFGRRSRVTPKSCPRCSGCLDDPGEAYCEACKEALRSIVAQHQEDSGSGEVDQLSDSPLAVAGVTTPTAESFAKVTIGSEAYDEARSTWTVSGTDVDPTSEVSKRLKDIGSKVLYLIQKPPLYNPKDLLSGRVAVPDVKGVYAWYFNRLPSGMDGRHLLTVRNWSLLYVGIGGDKESSNSTLQSRLLGKHLKSDASDSTVRASLGSLLRRDLNLNPNRRYNGFWFGQHGEDVLTEWICEHVAFNFLTDDAPWEVEQYVLSKYGWHLPLNIKGNPTNTFAASLKAARNECRRAAGALPITAEDC